MDLSKGLKMMGLSLRKNSPQLLTGIGIVGMATSVILAIKATPDAHCILSDYKINKFELEHSDDYSKDEVKEILKKDKINMAKDFTKLYLPSFISFGLSTSAIIFSNKISGKRIAALSAAYSIAEQKIFDYDKKVKENVQDKTYKKIKDEIDQDEIDKKSNEDLTVKKTGKGSTLILDSITGQFIESDPLYIDSMINELNSRLNGSMDHFISLNEFLYELDMNSSDIGDELGWDDLISIEWGHGMTKDPSPRPCLVMRYRVYPRNKERY